MFPNKERNSKELNELVRALAWNDAFGCYTRAGFEKIVWPEIAERARWIIYFDIDDMHALNEANGSYDAVDGMIHQAFGSLRFTDHVASQFKSGDEFLVCLTDDSPQSPIIDQREQLDPHAMTYRLIDALKKVGLTATFAIVQVTSLDLLANVKPAIDQVFIAKQNRGR